jgi:hypothetical protein
MKPITLFILLAIPLIGFSQNKDPEKNTQQRTRPVYFGVSSGLAYSGFRDFATSPLTYNGSPLYLSFDRLKADNKRESELLCSFMSGNYSKGYNSQFNTSRVKTVTLSYDQIFRLERLSSEGFSVKVGPTLQTTYCYRYNGSFSNNETGREVVMNLLGSVKITKDVSRRQEKDKRLIFFNYRLIPRSRVLSFRTNVGVLNTSYRNGFSYTGNIVDPKADNRYTGYQFKAISGFRMSASIDYTIYLKNKNAVQLSYAWDAYKTGGERDVFEMAHHIFKVTLLFNTNNR